MTAFARNGSGPGESAFLRNLNPTEKPLNRLRLNFASWEWRLPHFREGDLGHEKVRLCGYHLLSLSAFAVNLIFLVGDGMSANHVLLANILESRILEIMKLPYNALTLTYSADSYITDSAPRWYRNFRWSQDAEQINQRTS